MKRTISKKWFGPWALITGTSSGIGQAFAERLARASAQWMKSVKIPDVAYLTKAACIVAAALALNFSAHAEGVTPIDSPLVLIPIDDLKSGVQIEGHMIGDMGNGQPLSMFSFNYHGQLAMFVTSAGHGPRIIPVASLQHAKVMTEAGPSHLHELPEGVVGKAVMFEESSLHAGLLNEKFFVSLTRDANSGKLNLEALPTFPLLVDGGLTAV